jgi:hypothetical protein
MKPEWRIPFRRWRRIEDDNIKIKLKEVVCIYGIRYNIQ